MNVEINSNNQEKKLLCAFATVLWCVATCWVLLAQIWSLRLRLGQTWDNNTQHVATGWPNARKMLRPTMLRYVALACRDLLTGALHVIWGTASPPLPSTSFPGLFPPNFKGKALGTRLLPPPSTLLPASTANPVVTCNFYHWRSRWIFVKNATNHRRLQQMKNFKRYSCDEGGIFIVSRLDSTPVLRAQTSYIVHTAQY